MAFLLIASYILDLQTFHARWGCDFLLNINFCKMCFLLGSRQNFILLFLILNFSRDHVGHWLLWGSILLPPIWCHNVLLYTKGFGYWHLILTLCLCRAPWSLLKWQVSTTYMPYADFVRSLLFSMNPWSQFLEFIFIFDRREHVVDENVEAGSLWNRCTHLWYLRSVWSG